MKLLLLVICLLIEINYSLSVLESFVKRAKQSEFFAKLINQKHTSIVEKQRYFDHYDFIIVGSGPGGCVLANRLTENKKWNVLLIEAGKVETALQDVPVLAAYMQSTAFNWGFVSEPQAGSCFGMDENRCGFPRGKALGGTSVINYMIYNRGNKNDFDRWAAAGNYGWSWNEVLPYFLKSERSTLEGFENSPYHNRHGEMSVEYNRHRTLYSKLFVKASNHLGLREVDYNSGQQLGVSFLQANTLNGRRHSAFKAFIEPILNRPNLHVMINTRATKVLIDPSTKIAYGVELLRNRKRYRISARKEVILSAGTFMSPQMLMLSGIGMKSDLNRIGIPVIQELPVGKIMYDHTTHIGVVFVANTTGESLNSDRAIQPTNVVKFLHGQGILTVPGGVEALGFIKTNINNFRGETVPDVELIFLAGGYFSDEGTGVRRGIRITDKIYNSVYKRLEDRSIDAFTVAQMLFHPKSVGYLELKSSNPFHWPKFYHNFFKNADDVETMLEGIKATLKLVNTPQFKSIGARVYSVPLPNCAHIHFGTDDYWRCSIRTLSSSLHHQTSTCKMGPITDHTAVVSPELKVYGFKNLRVVDTSIIPEAPTAHTNAMSVMIGEKCADMIKRQWS